MVSDIPELSPDTDQLQDDLDKFIYYYNLKRTNQCYHLKSEIPYMKFLDGMRKFSLPGHGMVNIVSITIG